MKVEKITIVSSKGKAQTMTLKEAKELYESLDEIFGSKMLYEPPRYIFEKQSSIINPWPQIIYGDTTLTTTSTTTGGLRVVGETAGEG